MVVKKKVTKKVTKVQGGNQYHSWNYIERVEIEETRITYLSDTVYSMKDILDSYQEYRRNCCDNNY